MIDKEKIFSFYVSQIQDNFFPYWQSKYDEKIRGF